MLITCVKIQLFGRVQPVPTFCNTTVLFFFSTYLIFTLKYSLTLRCSSLPPQHLYIEHSISIHLNHPIEATEVLLVDADSPVQEL
jgi:hypothetical protein